MMMSFCALIGDLGLFVLPGKKQTDFFWVSCVKREK
jgi:hypothetical protein